MYDIKIKDIEYLCSINDCPIVITSINHPFKIIYVNKSWEYLCGYKYNEILGKSIFILKFKDINKKKNVFINKKKNNKLFLHIFDIYDIPSLQLSIGTTSFYKNL